MAQRRRDHLQRREGAGGAMDNPGSGLRLAEEGDRFPLRVSIVSPARFYRDGIAGLLTELGFKVVEPSILGPTVLESLAMTSPDLILLDISCEAGRAMLRCLGEHAPHIRVVVLAVSGDDEELLECAQAGVAGYVTCGDSLKDLVSILSSVAQGELRCLPGAAGALRRRLAALAAAPYPRGSANALTAREAEILHCLQHRLSNKEIAGRLGIEVSTVKSHVHKILEKLSLRRRSEACLPDRRGITHVDSLFVDGAR